MNSATARQRQHVLQQMEQIEHMERGALDEEYRTRVVEGVWRQPLGPEVTELSVPAES